MQLPELDTAELEALFKQKQASAKTGAGGGGASRKKAKDEKQTALE